MPRLPSLPWAGQGARFVIVGLVQLLVDWAGYVLLTWAGLDTAWANPASRALAVVLGFWLHGSYTFADADGARLGRSRVWRFLATWAGLTVLGTVALHLLVARFSLGAAWLAKPAIEAVLAVISFLVLRGWVFRK